MSKLIIKSSLIAAVFVGYSSLTHGQHSQAIHEELVDDFYSPYPFTLSEQQTFSGTIGVVKQKDQGDWWDYYVFQSPSSGKVEIALDAFDRPVNLSLETSFPSGYRQKKTIAESSNRFIDYHQISAAISPETTYYIAVGTGVMDNGLTPYSLTVKFTESEPKPFSPAESGDYTVAAAGKPCAVESKFSSLKLPVYTVSEHGTKLSTQSEQSENKDKRIHEIFRFEPTQGMLVHEFSDVLFEEDSAVSLQRDIVIVGNFEAGGFHGEARQRDILKDASGNVVQESGECSRKVTAIGQ